MNSLYDPRDEHDACGVGFVARLDGRADHAIIENALAALSRLAHRGGGCIGESADGAGILLPLPRDFMRRAWHGPYGELPEKYGLAHVFLPANADDERETRQLLESAVQAQGLQVLAWRDTPVRPEILGKAALKSMPTIRQLAVSALNADEDEDEEDFERRLYIARRRAEKLVAEQRPDLRREIHIASFSCRSVVYKGMLPGGQLAAFYPDLAVREFEAHFAVFHERYSTNTKPAWRLAQPLRCLAHNGEINTLRCNQAQMAMREPLLSSPLFGEDIKYVTPVLDETGSDSVMLDNTMELLARGGRTLPHAAMMLLPEPFGKNFIMGEDKRAFYEYHASIMEPWDGPAALVFTDGSRLVGAMLDRNALRSCRYAQTKDGLFLLASEAGVLDLPDKRILRRGRLQPRRMLMVDFARGRVISDAECKGRVIYAKPYRHWVRENSVTLRDLPPWRPLEHPENTAGANVSTRLAVEGNSLPIISAVIPQQGNSGADGDSTRPPGPTLLQSQILHGYTKEDLADILEPMARNAQEPVASMGDDTPLAALSTRPQLLFSYLKQRFAQVTNPPIDPLREGLVMSLMGFAGRGRNLLAETPEHYARLRLANPVLWKKDLDRLRYSTHPQVRTVEIPMLFKIAAHDGAQALKQGLSDMFMAADEALEQGATILLLSDREAGRGYAPIPSLLAVSGLRQHLLRKKTGHSCGIIVDAGDAREVIHLAQLIAFGANAAHPRVAFATVEAMGGEAAIKSYTTALQKGLLKTFSRMGISTLRSFLGGQGFEVLGFGKNLIERYFTGLPSRIGGIGLGEIAADILSRHMAAFDSFSAIDLKNEGRHRWRKNGERHLWTPVAVRALHKAVRENNWQSYREYATESDEQAERPVTLRGLLRFAGEDGNEKSRLPAQNGKNGRHPLPLEEVEAEESIMLRFVGSAMSYGSISPEAHEALAVALNNVGGRSNCGEGGEDPARTGSRRSRVRQIASGRFGVNALYLVNADEIQIKMAQGAKPGEGGQLPGHKVLPHIAKVRHTTPGVTLISPPPHHDIYSIEDLAQLVFDLKNLNPLAKVSVKLVAGPGVGAVASGVVKAGADIILISGHDGGTGASPRTAISHVGLPWELGLAEVHQTLTANGLRERIILQTDGQLRTGRDLAVAAMLGAEEFGFGTGLLVALGCCMLRICHKGTCPAGVAAQDPELRERFGGKPEHVERYLRFMARDLREYMAALGLRSVKELVGRADLLRAAQSGQADTAPSQKTLSDINLDRSASLDLSPLLAYFYHVPNRRGQGASFLPAPAQSAAFYPPRLRPCEPRPDSPLDRAMLEVVLPAAREGRTARFAALIHNDDRAICARLSGEIARLHGERGLTPGSIEIDLTGTAGQSAGAFLMRGIRLHINGEANDYAGKGLSGGVLAVAPPRGAARGMEAGHTAVGNVALYGAISGEAYFSGSAGERFAVRNSGASAVVEGVGDHACEYMTGGIVVVLGPTGYNFAAGMSGGEAYVYDRSELFLNRCNMDGVNLESVWRKEDVVLLRSLLSRHYRHTGSELARIILEDWRASLPLFLKITPIEYRRALERLKANEGAHVESVSATEEVYSDYGRENKGNFDEHRNTNQ